MNDRGVDRPALHGRANEQAGIVMRAEMPVAVAIGKGEGLRGPCPRRTDKSPARIDDLDHGELRKKLHPLGRQSVQPRSGCRMPEPFRRRRTAGQDARPDLLRNEIAPLGEMRDLRGDGSAEVGQVAPVAADRPGAQIPDRKSRGEHDAENQADTEEGKATARTEIPSGALRRVHGRSPFAGRQSTARRSARITHSANNRTLTRREPPSGRGITLSEAAFFRSEPAPTMAWEGASATVISQSRAGLPPSSKTRKSSRCGPRRPDGAWRRLRNCDAKLGICIDCPQRISTARPLTNSEMQQ